MSRLHTGKGNVIRQAEMLKSLGVKATKNLPESILEKALIEFDIEPQVDSVVSIPSTPAAMLDVSTGEHATQG
jgi:DNA recombination protein RmuC